VSQGRAAANKARMGLCMNPALSLAKRAKSGKRPALARKRAS
jgi:hypothetical protein